MYQQFYTRFLQANPGIQHYACHSHYYWPDVTRDAMCRYWDDSARLVDDKWQLIFEDIVPRVQQSISTTLNTSSPAQLVFAPNTHELVFRILSCLDLTKPVRIVTTDSEFYSFDRQISRLEEEANVAVERVPLEPFATFEQRFAEAARRSNADLVFFSQVFFNSGLVVKDLEAIVKAIPSSDTLVVIDGYHGFRAIPTDLAAVEDRAFYLAGSYKYAQGGEGACFAHIPQGSQLRPRYTGWFAAFEDLDKPKTGKVGYSNDGMRFAGATMDFSALYRLQAVFDLFEEQGITVEHINQYIKDLQQVFLTKLAGCNHPLLNRQTLLVSDLTKCGHFLTFALPDAQTTQRLATFLKEHDIVTDYRGNRLRFGFALYHRAEEIDLRCLQC